MTAPPTDFCKFLVSTSHTTKLKKQPLFSCSYSAAISVTSTNSNHKANSTIQGRSCMEAPGSSDPNGFRQNQGEITIQYCSYVWWTPASNASDPPKISGFTPATINTKVNCGKIQSLYYKYTTISLLTNDNTNGNKQRKKQGDCTKPSFQIKLCHLWGHCHLSFP